MDHEWAAIKRKMRLTMYCAVQARRGADKAKMAKKKAMIQSIYIYSLYCIYIYSIYIYCSMIVNAAVI